MTWSLWEDRSEITFTNWAVGVNFTNVEDNQCALMESRSPFWNISNCDSANDFICKNTKREYLIRLLWKQIIIKFLFEAVDDKKCSDGWTQADSYCYKVFLFLKA